MSLKYSHCCVNGGDREAEQVLSTEEAFDIIDKIRDVGTLIVVLSAGEPLLPHGLCEIAQKIRNGYLSARSMPARMRDAGIRSVEVSIDSTDPALYDYIFSPLIRAEANRTAFLYSSGCPLRSS